MPDTTFSTSMKPLWFHEPLTFQPPICPRSSPRGGIRHPAGGVTAWDRNILTPPGGPCASHLVDELHQGLCAQLLDALLLEAGQVVALRLPLRLAARVEAGVFCTRGEDRGSALGACGGEIPHPRVSPPRWCPHRCPPPRRCFMMAWFWSQMLLKVLHLERPVGRGFLLIQPPQEYW